MKQVVIIGGGSSGLVCAMVLGRLVYENQLDVNITILEQKDKVGKKLLATGNGRCNLSNKDLDIQHYEGHHIDLLKDKIESFDMKQWLEEYGLWTKYMGDLLYPQSEQAQSVYHMLSSYLKQYQVEIITSTKVTQIKKGFTIVTPHKNYPADYVVVATGSDAAPHFGSDGSGFKLLKQCGHTIYPSLPSLVQLKCTHKDNSLKGVRIHGTFSLYVDNDCIKKEKGELLFTDYGVSGISILQLSRYYVLNKNRKVEIGLDVMDEYSVAELKEKLRKQLALSSNLLFHGIIHQKYANYLEKYHLKEYSYKELNRMIKLLKDFRITILDTNGKENAQVCIGGADLLEFNSETFESKIIDHLYAGGEVIDVAGDCGGYNLHFAFLSGKMIAQGIFQALLMEELKC